MKLQVFDCAWDVPKRHNVELRKMGIPHGSLRDIFFADVRQTRAGDLLVHEVVIITDKDIPVSWGIIVKGDAWNYKSAMFYTRKPYRCKGLAARIHFSMKERHPRFAIYADRHNAKFFQSVGRRVEVW